jgi:hypothetical protein
MQEGAMPLMPMLAMGERDIPIGFYQLVNVRE